MENETSDQAPGQSLEDRIASKFMDVQDIQETESAPEPEQEEEVVPEIDEVEIEFDGDRYKIPKKLEKGFLQERDYTQKTQELADKRRLIEQHESALKLAQMEGEFIQSVRTEHQQLSQLEGYLQQLNSQDFRGLSAEEKLDHLNEVRVAEHRRDGLLKSLESKRKDFDGQVNKHIDEVRGKAKEALSKLIPSFNDDTLKSMREYAKTQGFSEDAFDRIALDAKSAAVLWKAHRFDQLQAEKASAVQKVTSPTIKPSSSNPMPQKTKDKLALNKAIKGATSRKERDALMQKRVELMF